MRPASAATRCQGMGEMAGKDQKAFHQACQDHGNHDDGQGAHDLANHVTHKEYGRKSGDSRRHGGKHRHGHVSRPGLGSLQWRITHGITRCGVFPHNNGVVNNDAKHHDQCKKRDHVDGLAQQQHDPDGCQHGDRNACCDPERNPGIEENEQDGDHENKAAHAVANEQHDAFEQRVGGDIVFLQYQARRQGIANFAQIVIKDLRRGKRIGSGGALDGYFDCPCSGCKALDLSVFITLSDIGNVAETNFLTCRERADFQFAQGSRILEVRQRAQLAFNRAAGLAGRHVPRIAGNALRNLGDRHSKPAQLAFGDVDLQFLVAKAAEGDLVDATGNQVIADLAGMNAKGRFRQVAGKRKRCNPVEKGNAADLGSL